MKKIIIFIAVTAFGLLLAKTSQAAVWEFPYQEGVPYKVGDCILVDQPSEADATHVYTLNPDYTYNLNPEYLQRWGRNARCDELQFHVDHSTTKEKLVTWLNSVAYGWYQNLKNTHFEGKTVFTSTDEFFLVKNGELRRIPDILTAWSWGLLSSEDIRIDNAMKEAFYKYAKIGAPLPFSEGQYASKITARWKNGDRDFSSLPNSLATVIEHYANGYSKLFSTCPTAATSDSDRGSGGRYDWRWLKGNPGYRLCPTSPIDEYDWRAGRCEWSPTATTCPY